MNARESLGVHTGLTIVPSFSAKRIKSEVPHLNFPRALRGSAGILDVIFQLEV